MIRDDGKGFNSRTVSEHYEEGGSFGLLNMRERARLINANFDLITQPNQGTTILLTLLNNDPHQLGTSPLSVSLPYFSNTNG
jgi:signal transduction histidine kinase